MRAPDLEALIAEGEQEALLDFGYAHVVSLLDAYGPGTYVDSSQLHAQVGGLLAQGQLPADDVTVIYDAIWSIKRLLEDTRRTGRAGFHARDWADAARTLSGQLSGGSDKPHNERYRSL